MILSTTYFGPVQWYQKVAREGKVWLEGEESFVKQTYRNRCVITGPQGKEVLTVPVEHGSGGAIRDIRLSDHGEWRRQHWNAIQTCYGESPFLEYYEDDLRPFFTERRWETLWDFNMDIMKKMLELLQLEPEIHITTEYRRPEPDTIDWRTAIRPKAPVEDPDFTPVPYYQVFAARNGFIANASILDLLLNMGNEAGLWLLRG